MRKGNFMAHPTHEQWMDYLYGETPPARRAELDRHLESCAECRAQVAEWRSAMQALDAWQLPAAPARPKVAPARPWWQWAAAAVVVLGVGFGLGRLAAPGVDVAALRAQLEPQLRQQAKRDLEQLAASQRRELQLAVAELVQALDEQRASDRRAVVNLLKEQEARHQVDLAALRRDLETVAVMTDGGLRNAQQQIGRLVALTQNEPK